MKKKWVLMILLMVALSYLAMQVAPSVIFYVVAQCLFYIFLAITFLVVVLPLFGSKA